MIDKTYGAFNAMKNTIMKGGMAQDVTMMKKALEKNGIQDYTRFLSKQNNNMFMTNNQPLNSLFF